MAILSVKNLSSIKLKLNYGVDLNGKAVVKSKTFPNVKADATDDSIFEVANALVKLQEHSLVYVIRVDNTSLSA